MHVGEFAMAETVINKLQFTNRLRCHKLSVIAQARPLKVAPNFSLLTPVPSTHMVILMSWTAKKTQFASAAMQTNVKLTTLLLEVPHLTPSKLEEQLV